MGSTLFSNNESSSNDLNFKDLLRGLIDTESCKEGENCGWPLFDGILYLHLYWVGICIHYIPDNAFAPDIRTSSFSQQVSYLSEN